MYLRWLVFIFMMSPNYWQVFQSFPLMNVGDKIVANWFDPISMPSPKLIVLFFLWYSKAGELNFVVTQCSVEFQMGGLSVGVWKFICLVNKQIFNPSISICTAVVDRTSSEGVGNERLPACLPCNSAWGESVRWVYVGSMVILLSGLGWTMPLMSCFDDE